MASVQLPVFEAPPNRFISQGGARPSGGLTSAGAHVPNGALAGLGFPAGVVSDALFPFRVGATVSLATGITVDLLLAEDLAVGNQDPINKKQVYGITIGPYTEGTSLTDESCLAACTEVLGTVTLPNTPGTVQHLSIAVPNASMNSLAISNMAVCRLRRLSGASGNAGDTSKARGVVFLASGYDT